MFYSENKKPAEADILAGFFRSLIKETSTAFIITSEADELLQWYFWAMAQLRNAECLAEYR
jgi:hypothetical protein